MTRSRSWFLALVLGFGVARPGNAHADSESARYLRNAIHYYDIGRYERSLGYFKAVLWQGTAHERAVARIYLKKTPLYVLLNIRKEPESVASEAHSRDVLKKGVQLFNEGKFRESYKALTEVAHNGTFDQQVVARSYLNRAEMQGINDQVLDEPETTTVPEETSGRVESTVHASGYLKEEFGYRISSPRTLSLLRSTGFGALTGQLSDAVSYKISARAYYNAVFALNRTYPPAVAQDERDQETLRDTYVDISQGNWDARVGKQQIVWGEAIGQFIADVVNARDLRESVLPSFEFIRIPQWGTDVEYSRDTLHLEGVWLPIPEVDLTPRPGSEFAPALPTVNGLPLVFAPEDKPANRIDNGEVGGRASYRAGGWDASVFRFYTFDKAPVYWRTFTPTAIVLQPVHPRITYDGATVSKEIADVVVKGEFTYTEGKYLSTSDPASPLGVVKKDIVQYLVGADHAFPHNIEASLQVSQQRILDYDPALFNQRAVQTTVSTTLRQSYWNDRLAPSLEVVTDFPYDDYLIHPALSYKWASHWSAEAGFDFFGGSTAGPFGQFRNRNRVISELRYDF